MGDLSNNIVYINRFPIKVEIQSYSRDYLGLRLDLSISGFNYLWIINDSTM